MSHSMDTSEDYTEIVAYASEYGSAAADAKKHSKTKKKVAEISGKAKDYAAETLSEESGDFDDMTPEQACDEIYSLFIRDVFSTRYLHKIDLKKAEEAIKFAIYEVVMNWTEVKMIMEY